MHPVADAELGENVRDMGLDRGRGQVEFAADLGIGQAGGASPSTTVRMPATSSAGETSLSRKPLARTSG